MKKFITNILIFFGIVAVVDFAAGKVFCYLQSHAGGRTGAEWYACKEMNEDIIIMGSSRASHHYVPQILSDSLGLTCFNAGQDGNGIILQYGRWRMISDRFTPQLIIYDVSSNFDMAVNDNMTYIDRLKPFCSDKNVKRYIASLFPLEQIKVQSKMYCYNYKFIEMVSDWLRGGDYMKTSGYIPLSGHIRSEVVEKKPMEKESTIEIDVDKLFYLEQLVKEARAAGTKVVFVVSPTWRGGNYEINAYKDVISLATKYNIPFIEYIESEISENPDFFEDSSHLNDKGAKVFTENVVSQI